jgi:hypothetical protein
MNSRIVLRSLIVACVIAVAWWLLRSESALQPSTSPPRALQVNSSQPVNTAQPVNTDQTKPDESVEVIHHTSGIMLRVAAAEPDPPHVELQAAVQDMLQTLKSQGYPAFADKYLFDKFIDSLPGVMYTLGQDEHLDPSFKALGFGDLNQLTAELESMQNSIPRYDHDRITALDENGHVLGGGMDEPHAVYDLPLFPGGPKEFHLSYDMKKKLWLIVPQSGNTNVW